MLFSVTNNVFEQNGPFSLCFRRWGLEVRCSTGCFTCLRRFCVVTSRVVRAFSSLTPHRSASTLAETGLLVLFVFIADTLMLGFKLFLQLIPILQLVARLLSKHQKRKGTNYYDTLYSGHAR
jgi:hypothetical protein